MLLPVLAFAQGTTTGSIEGQITDVNGEPLPGANVIAVHMPTGSGKTTTLYSTLKQLASSEVNVSTIEDPIEFVHRKCVVRSSGLIHKLKR